MGTPVYRWKVSFTVFPLKRLWKRIPKGRSVFPFQNAPPTNPATPSTRHPCSKTTHHTPRLDPDPSSTTHCTHPDSSSGTLVQCALMIDAGSTGSRIHVSDFNNCGPSPEYGYIVFKMTQPGLSSFAATQKGLRGAWTSSWTKKFALCPRPCTGVHRWMLKLLLDFICYGGHSALIS